MISTQGRVYSRVHPNRRQIIYFFLGLLFVFFIISSCWVKPNSYRASPSKVFWHGSDRDKIVGKKGVTLWMTGLSGSGKSTIAVALEQKLLKRKETVYRLDGDNLRFGINNDLGFSSEDRSENIRRVAEISKLFADSAGISIVSLISPTIEDRQRARDIHEQGGVAFLEVFVDAPLDVVEKRDPKGLYKKARAGEIKGFTGIDAPFEAPLNPEIHLKTNELSVMQSVEVLQKELLSRGHVLSTGRGLYDAVVPTDGELFVPPNELATMRATASSLPSLTLSTLDLQWVQVLGEGWAYPLTGFMRRVEYLQSLHFKTIKKGVTTYSMPVPMVLPVTTEDKKRLEDADKIALKSSTGTIVAILSNPEFFEHRKRERVARTFGTATTGDHPYIELIMKAGDWLVGGDLAVLGPIQWGDDLQSWRQTPAQLRKMFKEKNADAVFAFQFRNPIHNGHAFLMTETRKALLARGYKNPVLWLSPLGGWTKDDDVPLNVRMRQHQAVINEGVLPANDTVLSIFPAPMLYAGPTEVVWHALSRMNAGANFYIVGRDPAGIKYEGSDLYDPDDGKMVLNSAPGLEEIEILPFKQVGIDKTTGKMNFFDPSRPNDFNFVSGTKMRQFARSNTDPPEGFMAPSGWKVLVEYYQSLN